ncbi:MAG: HAD family phosphatase [Candidatus Aenigmarchaeota archaeon]|nr:HAD family phosphatase [Candidatus Aenigmarchaeota archaeon]
MPDFKFAVIFDMDGVIIDSNPFHKKAWRLFFQRHGLSISENDFKRHVYGKINADIFSYFFRRRLTKTEVRRYNEEKESLYRKLIARHMAPARGLVRFLELLKKAAIPCAVATSAPPENVGFVMGKMNIRSYFRAIVDDSQISRGKPNPEIYLKAAKKLCFMPEACVVFEDSVAGIRAAKNAGMKVVAITTTHTKRELSEAHLVISDFTQIGMEVLRSLFELKGGERQ